MFPENREVFQICIQIISLFKLYNLDDKKYYEFLSRNFSNLLKFMSSEVGSGLF